MLQNTQIYIKEEEDEEKDWVVSLPAAGEGAVILY
jgi:hypothetical protein